MNAEGQLGADPIHSSESIGTGPQVGNIAKKLKGMALLLKRVALVCLSDQIYGLDFDFVFLSLADRLGQLPLHTHRGPGEDLLKHRPAIRLLDNCL